MDAQPHLHLVLAQPVVGGNGGRGEKGETNESAGFGQGVALRMRQVWVLGKGKFSDTSSVTLATQLKEMCATLLDHRAC